MPGPAAEWVEPGGRQPFVGVLTLELPTDADDDVAILDCRGHAADLLRLWQHADRISPLKRSP